MLLNVTLNTFMSFAGLSSSDTAENMLPCMLGSNQWFCVCFYCPHVRSLCAIGGRLIPLQLVYIIESHFFTFQIKFKAMHPQAYKVLKVCQPASNGNFNGGFRTPFLFKPFERTIMFLFTTQKNSL